MADFSTLLSKPLDTIEKPKAWPAGTYHGRVLRYEVGESQQKKTPYVRLHLAVSHAGEDIDQDLLAGIDLTKRQFRRDYYLTPEAEYRLKDLLVSCDIPTAGRTWNETLPELINCAVIMSVTQRPSQDGSEMYNDVDNLKGDK